MKNLSKVLATIALAILFASPAFATTSSINPTQPAQNAPLLSATIRTLALAAYNDITALFGDFTVGANQVLGSIAGGQAGPLTVPNCSVLGFNNGFICAGGTGISALTGDVTASGTGTVSATLANTTSARANIGLGLASTPGFAGLALTGVENINLNSGALLAALTGAVAHSAQANATLSRYQLDAFGNSAHFSSVRYDGTAASPTAVQSGEVIGSFNGWAYDGTSLGTAAGSAFQIATTQIWTPSAHGANASVWTTPNGATAPVQQVIVGNDGGVTIGVPAGGDQGVGTLNVQGLFIGGVAVSAGASSINLGSITTANPHISADVTSGLYSAGAALVDVGISGVKVAEWSAGGSSFAGTTTASNVTITGNTLLQGTTTANNFTVTGTCTGCGTPAFVTQNTQIGTGALSANTTGTDNTAFGFNALHTSITDSGNTAFGSKALQNYAVGNTTTVASPSGNTAVGYSALGAITTATGNTGVGFNALLTNIVSTNNTAVGTNALKVAVGTTGVGNNTAVGTNALAANTIGFSNTAIGNGALATATGAQGAVVIGNGACPTVTGGVCIGSGTAGSATGATVIYIGPNVGTGVITSGTKNILMGFDANARTALNGSSNIFGMGDAVRPGATDIAIGNNSLSATTTDNLHNTAVGYQSTSSLTSGAQNTGLGYQSLFAGTAVTTGTGNTAIGYQAQVTSASAANRTAIGNGAISTADNDFVMGNSSVATLHAAVTTITAISDARDKEGIEPSDLGLDFINKINPVIYRLKASNYVQHYGFIAQQVESALPSAYRDLIESNNPESQLALLDIRQDGSGHYEMGYTELIAPMVKSIQELDQRIRPIWMLGVFGFVLQLASVAFVIRMMRRHKK